MPKKEEKRAVGPYYTLPGAVFFHPADAIDEFADDLTRTHKAFLNNLVELTSDPEEQIRLVREWNSKNR